MNTEVTPYTIVDSTTVIVTLSTGERTLTFPEYVVELITPENINELLMLVPGLEGL